jgi:hypothetical protein
MSETIKSLTYAPGEPAFKPPLSARITPRMIFFGLVMLVLVGYPLYVFVESAVTGGIKDIGGGYKQVDLKAMSTFYFDGDSGKVEDVPPKWRSLDGQKIVVVGEMWQPYSAGNQIKGFELVYSIAQCCFNGPPQIQHFVQAKVIPGKSVGYHSGPVRVSGTLRVDVTRDELGKITGVYHLDVEDVRPVS